MRPKEFGLNGTQEVAPLTRASLILRLPDHADRAAWDEFVSLYRPMVLRVLMRGGLQMADAEEVAQDVFVAVSKAVERWRPDPDRGRFRAWLGTITRRLMINFLVSRRGRPLGSGRSDVIELLDQQVDPRCEESALVNLEHRRELFLTAAEKVRESFRVNSWQAFWLSSVEDLSVEETAKRLGMSNAAVYIARSRALARIREEVQRLEELGA